jgi:acetyl-CoA carboxylase biotin carboxyl carrier protein
MAEQTVEADISGTVVRIECQIGVSLGAGDTLIVVESMKMEIPVSAPEEAKVLSILVAVGDTITEGQVVAVISTA